MMIEETEKTHNQTTQTQQKWKETKTENREKKHTQRTITHIIYERQTQVWQQHI